MGRITRDDNGDPQGSLTQGEARAILSALADEIQANRAWPETFTAAAFGERGVFKLRGGARESGKVIKVYDAVLPAQAVVIEAHIVWDLVERMMSLYSTLRNAARGQAGKKSPLLAVLLGVGGVYLLKKKVKKEKKRK